MYVYVRSPLCIRMRVCMYVSIYIYGSYFDEILAILRYRFVNNISYPNEIFHCRLNTRTDKLTLQF